MGRKCIIRTSHLPYHVTVRSNNREWFYLPRPEVWKIFTALLMATKERHNLGVHALVLMANHLHIILSTPNADLDVAMKYFLRECSRSVNKKAGRINHLFGGPYKWSLIGDSCYYLHAEKYLYRNPVKAGACKKVESYPFSTVRWQAGDAEPLFALAPSPFGPPRLDRGAWLEHLNVAYTKEEDDCVRRALRRREFAFKCKKDQRRLPGLFAEFDEKCR